MRMHQISFFTLMSSMIVSCSNAKAETLSASNSVHCTAALTYFEIIARSMGDEKSARGLYARSDWYGKQTKILPREERSRAIVDAVAKKLAADPDAAARNGTECQKLQDQHPGWQAKIASAKEHAASSNDNSKTLALPRNPKTH